VRRSLVVYGKGAEKAIAAYAATKLYERDVFKIHRIFGELIIQGMYYEYIK
jgi:hypothetical protein